MRHVLKQLDHFILLFEDLLRHHHGVLRKYCECNPVLDNQHLLLVLLDQHLRLRVDGLTSLELEDIHVLLQHEEARTVRWKRGHQKAAENNLGFASVLVVDLGQLGLRNHIADVRWNLVEELLKRRHLVSGGEGREQNN